eukprot:3999567-Amphidinium_carterae.1
MDLLRPRVQEHDDFLVRREAVEALAAVAEKGLQEALKLLRPRLKDKDSHESGLQWTVRRAAVQAVDKLCSRQDVGLVRHVLTDPEPRVQLEAIEILHRRGR